MVDLRRRARIAAALVALAAGAALGQGVEPFAWANPEFANGHVSVGRVKVVYPVMNFDFGAGVDFGVWGRILASAWTQTDLSDKYLGVRRQFLQEFDPKVAYGHCWEFMEGWRLNSEWGHQWNMMVGYKGRARRSYDEWQFTETLETPWAGVFVQMRNFYYPVDKASIRTGVFKSFELTERLSAAPMVWLDGGGERWNEQRFGHGDPASIGRGFNSVSVRLYLWYRIMEGLRAYGGVTQYCVIDGDARDELDSNPSREAKADFTVVTTGLRYDF